MSHRECGNLRNSEAQKTSSSFTTEGTEDTEVCLGCHPEGAVFAGRRIYGLVGSIGDAARLHRSLGAIGRRLRMTSEGSGML